jgi:uracil-DNA glycosylase family 4
MIEKQQFIRRYEEFDGLCASVRRCDKCPRMSESTRILSRAAGKLGSAIMFVGEAPGRMGADNSGIPFHGDTAGHNFESFLESAGLSRAEVFVTNAVLCNPRDGNGNNASPNSVEIQNCSNFLRHQIELVEPKIVVTLGANSLRAMALVESHSLVLGRFVRTANRWYHRVLIPLYHPGQRAMIHRSFANQRSDYQFVAEQAKRIGVATKEVNGKTKADVALVAQTIIEQFPGITYFALHKLLFLLELAHVRQHGDQLTRAYFIRQKDGPYCVDLHLKKLQKALPKLSVRGTNNLWITSNSSDDLFAELTGNPEDSVGEKVRSILSRYRGLADADLKTKVYFTTPMRRILREERNRGMGLFNLPINLGVAL